MPQLLARDAGFEQFVAEQRSAIDAAIERWLPGAPSCPEVLADGMRYATGAGGKRVRPLLTLITADAVAASGGGSDAARAAARAAALPAACAIEFVHTQSLVHDDLPAMDDDTMRRGQPTVHVRFGEAMAILVGDGLLAHAFAILAGEPRTSDPVVARRKLRVVTEVCDAVGPSGMVAGQALDLAYTGRCGDGASSPFDVADVEDMHRRKTGGLIRASAAAGAIMAGGHEAQLAGIRGFADHLGLAFQIVDDILDVQGCLTSLGKTAGKDAGAAKLTYPALVGMERARTLAVHHLDQARSALDASGVWAAYLQQVVQSVAIRLR